MSDVGERLVPNILERPKRDELYKLYWIENKSLSRISQLYGVAHWTIGRWMNKYGIVRRDRGTATRLWRSLPEVKAHMSMKRRRKFTARLGSALAYVLGVLRGDGSVYKSSKHRRCQIDLSVKDKSFTEKFAEALRGIGLKPSRIYICHNGQCRVQATSVDFYGWYKLLDLEKIRFFIRGFEEYFVCGFYESEGCINLHSSGRFRIHMYNKSWEVLSMIKDILLERWNIESRLFGPNKKGVFALCVQGDERVKKLLDIIEPCIKTSPRGCNKILSSPAREKVSLFNLDCIDAQQSVPNEL